MKNSVNRQRESVILLRVKVITRASRNEIVEHDGQITVRVTAAPTDGKANIAVVELLAEYFDVTKSRVKIVRGKASRQKTIVIV